MKKIQPHIDVSCATIEQNGLILAAQRSESMAMPLKWEIPGGKMEPDESAAALPPPLLLKTACSPALSELSSLPMNCIRKWALLLMGSASWYSSSNGPDCDCACRLLN